MVPSVSLAAYDAARHRAAFVDRSDERGRLVVSGRDRAAYLHGLLTNDIAALTAGRGCYAAYLTPQGRMITDVFVYEIGDLMLLSMDAASKATLLAKLDQFIFSEDVTLADVTDRFAQIAILGPDGPRVLAAVLGEIDPASLGALPEHGNRRALFRSEPVILTRISDAGQDGFELYVDRSHADALKEALTACDVAALDAATADAIRIEAGVPKFHRDMDEETIPLEAGIESRAISFSKGCYVGQEVIIRVLHRGHGRIGRRLVGLTLPDANAPAPGALVRSAAGEVGEVTSSTVSPSLGRAIGLAYVRREFSDPGTTLTVDGADALVTALPFVTPA
jgi:folate-binding protein YgfZ